MLYPGIDLHKSQMTINLCNENGDINNFYKAPAIRYSPPV
jgi:hypothetical protein